MGSNFVWRNNIARESAIIYAEALIEACKICKVRDPARCLIDADMFPRLRKVSDVEYAIGWLNGCAEAHGVTVEVLWTKVKREPEFDKRDDVGKEMRRARNPDATRATPIGLTRSRSPKIAIKRTGYDPNLPRNHPNSFDPTLEKP